MAVQGASRSLQHWDSALEESSYSPRISSRVTPLAAFDDSPAKGRTAPSMTPLPSGAAASDAHMPAEMPSDSSTSGCQILEVPIVPGFSAKPIPSGLPPSDRLASDAHTPKQKMTVLPIIPEAEEEGQAAEPAGNGHLLGNKDSPSEVTCDDEHDHETPVPNLAAALMQRYQRLSLLSLQLSNLLTQSQTQASRLQPCALLATLPLATPLLCWTWFLRLPWLKTQTFLWCLAGQHWMAPLSWLSAALWTHTAAPH